MQTSAEDLCTEKDGFPGWWIHLPVLQFKKAVKHQDDVSCSRDLSRLVLTHGKLCILAEYSCWQSQYCGGKSDAEHLQKLAN